MKKIICLVLCVVFLFGCATTKVNFNTNVEGAKIVVDGKPLGQTPVNSVKIKNKISPYKVIIEKEGYKTYQGRLEKETKDGAVAAVVIGYSFCWLILPALLLINALYVEGPVPDQYFVLEKTE